MDIEKIISQMSLEDKIAFCEGANFWETKAYEKYGIPSMFVCDGPNGLRKQISAVVQTCWVSTTPTLQPVSLRQSPWPAAGIQIFCRQLAQPSAKRPEHRGWVLFLASAACP